MRQTHSIQFLYTIHLLKWIWGYRSHRFKSVGCESSKLGCVANEREFGDARRCESGDALLKTADDNLSHAQAAIATRTHSLAGMRRKCERACDSVLEVCTRNWPRAQHRETVALVPNLLQFACSESTAETIISLSTLNFRNFICHLAHSQSSDTTDISQLWLSLFATVSQSFLWANTTINENIIQHVEWFNGCCEEKLL